MKCAYCGGEMPGVGFIEETACPVCGLVWEYDEGQRPTLESIREYAQKVMMLERERCAKILDEFDEGYIDPRYIAERIRKDNP